MKHICSICEILQLDTKNFMVMNGGLISSNSCHCHSGYCSIPPHGDLIDLRENKRYTLVFLIHNSSSLSFGKHYEDEVPSLCQSCQKSFRNL